MAYSGIATIGFIGTNSNKVFEQEDWTRIPVLTGQIINAVDEATKLNKVIYDISDVNNRPIGVRTKGTNETTNFDYRGELDGLTASEQEEWIKNHEYYIENKYYALMPGEKFIID